MRNKGFSVVELMIVLTMISILATLGAPSFIEMLDRRRLVAQTEAIAELVQHARLEAIKHSTTAGDRSISFTVTPTAPWYAGLKAGSAACDGTEADCSVQEGAHAVTRLVKNTECPSCTLTSPAAQQTLVFNFRGLVSGATDVPITVRSGNGRQLRIIVSRIGRLSICSVAGDVPGYPAC